MRLLLLKPYLFMLIFGVAAIFSSCKMDSQKPDVSEISVEIDFIRTEKDFFEIPLDSLEGKMVEFQNAYPVFFELYVSQIVPLGGINNPSLAGEMRNFVAYPSSQDTYRKCKEVFSDSIDLLGRIENAFRYLQYYFPKLQIPQVYTCLSAFNYSVFVGDGFIGIGLDRYLGNECEFYEKLGVEHYLRKKMYPEKMISDLMEAWVTTQYAYNDSVGDVLSRMVYNGQVQYFLDAVLPDTPDSVKLGFTQKQVEWCEQHEKNMWGYLIENKLLFSTDRLTIAKFLNDAPFTQGFTRESPGQAVSWLGREIVRAYMERNPNLSMQELLNNSDYHKILNQSRFKPS